MLPEPGPQNKPLQHAQSAVHFFDHCLTVYLVDGYDRTGTLMYIVLYHAKIRRRIERT